MDAAVFAALAEPNRRRILELLGGRPRSVGEVAGELEMRQPQATKHLQALERAGLVAVHPLGRRRIYALRREPFAALRDWAEAFAQVTAPEEALAQYEAAIAAEAAAPAQAEPRVIRLAQRLAAPPEVVWEWWTTAAHVRRWWAPDHFTVAEADVHAQAGGALRIVLAEGDGSRHTASGHFLRLDEPRALDFELSPLGPDGAPAFRAVQRVRLASAGDDVTLLTSDVTLHELAPGSEPIVAGVELGWRQTLARLAALLEAAKP